MRKYAVSVIALALTVGLSSAVPRPEVEISNYPIYIGDQLEVEGILRPIPSFPEFAPETDPEFETDPVLESEDITPPKVSSLNPCDACFEYMTALIDQLTEVAVPEAIPVHPELPEVELEPEVPEVGRPLPETVPEDIRPLPVPVAPEVEINPIPIPISPEVEIRPLPVPVAPEVEIRPIPFQF